MAKQFVRKITSTSINYGIRGGRRALRGHPAIRSSLKRVINRAVGASVGTDPYQAWLNDNLPDYVTIQNLKKELPLLTYKPKISIIVPTYNTDLQFLRDCFDSVLAQIYENWQLCIVDDASPDKAVRSLIEEYAADEPRITYKFLKKNKHIAGATNEAIALADGEFIGLFDHDDMLWPNALLEVVKALNEQKELDFIYTDEDKITENRHHHGAPFFKPDWNPDFLHSVNYITHFAVIRTSLLKKLSGLRSKYDGAQDWDLFMRITSETDKIHHIPKVLYSWRVHESSTAMSTDAKPYVVDAQRAAISDDLVRKGRPDAIVKQDAVHPGYWTVTYPVVDEPLVSIVIPTKNQYQIIKRCVDSIYEKSSYRKFEIIVVDTGSDDPKVMRWFTRMSQGQKNFKVISWPEKPFSYARSCNEGARNASGDVLIMLNNDTEVITKDWIEKLVGDAQRPEIGAVGCLLFFPDGHHIQHAGVGVGLGGVAANSFSMMTLQHAMSQTQHLMINTKHNMTVVTAACLAIRKQVFDEIDGFDESFRVTYNDVDLCLRLYEKGYQNLYTPHVRLLHHESISVGLPSEIAKRDTKEFQAAKSAFTKRWARYIEHDPNLNPNLSKDNALYELQVTDRSNTGRS